MAQGSFIKLTYSNSNDFGGEIIFSDNVPYELFLYGTLGESKIEFIEFVNKNENNEVSFTKKIMEESITIKTMGGEWIYKLLCFISMCDNVKVNNKLGELDTVLEMKVEADTKKISLINVKFIIKRTIWEQRDNNPVVALGCPVSTQDVVATIADNNAIYTAKTATLGEYYCLWNSTDSTIHNPPNNKYYIIKRVDSTAGWEFIEPTMYSRFKDLNQTDFYYVLKQNEAPDGIYFPVTQMPTLNDVTIAGANTLAEGECPSGYLVQVYESVDNINFFAVGAIVTADTFNANGIIFTPTAGRYFFKLALINYLFTVCLYSKSVNKTP